LAEITDRHTEALPVEVVLENPAHRILEAEARPIGGDFIQWVLTVRDVTVERESQARTQMQERLATVGQLAAGIAHDFNNIMAAILVYSDLLMTDTGLPPTSRERLTIIQQQVQRASSLIRQILDFSRRSVMEQSPLDLHPFVKELGKLLGRVLPENIQLDMNFADVSYVVKADPTRLQQAFMNLVLNARDAMPNGGRLCFGLSRCRIEAGEVSPYSEIPPGEWICIVISDTGQGIPVEVLPHIFEPFFTTKPVGQGTGLGLSQVYGIIKQHGGHIDVSSQLGEGSRFSVFLPALAAPLDEARLTEMPARLDGAGQTVLVVEDDQATRDALQALLHTHRFMVFAASNGAEALSILEKIGDTVSLVVTDVVMPEIGGMGLYRAVQEHWPQVKVLFVTGHPFDPSDRALLETGKVHWLQKPFSAHDFSDAIRALLLDA
jgi:two-component system cell cycle sensor histidine kinase/response regulator CckA